MKEGKYAKIAAIKILTILYIFFLGFFPLRAQSEDATLYLAPSKGTFFVGSTFSVSVLVDTKGKEINTVEVNIEFPSDILQVAAPTAGESFISEWLVPPSYSNTAGRISYLGGIPGGITTSAGLISDVIFRAKSPGVAKVKISDSSKVLLHDGKGTSIATIKLGGIYEILVLPPEGPKISSSSHPDSGIWHSNSSPSFSWEKEGEVTDFSFSLSQNSQEVPDTISEGNSAVKSYENVKDGIWYFHVRAKQKEEWGRASHFAVKIDATPPENFEPEFKSNSNFLYFETRDSHSGIEYYEVSLVPREKESSQSPFFIEASSPYKLPYQKSGKYTAIVRAHDRAGNYREVQLDFQIFTSFLSFIEGKGVQIKEVIFPWWFVYLILTIFILSIFILIFTTFRSKRGLKKGIKEIKEAISEIEKIEERERETQTLKEKFQKEKEKLEEKLYRSPR